MQEILVAKADSRACGCSEMREEVTVDEELFMHAQAGDAGGGGQSVFVI